MKEEGRLYDHMSPERTLIMPYHRTVLVLGFYLPFDEEVRELIANHLDVRTVETLARCVRKDAYLRSNLGSYVFSNQLALRAKVPQHTRFTQQRMKLLVDVAGKLEGDERRAYMFAFAEEVTQRTYPQKVVDDVVSVFKINLRGRFLWLLFSVTGERGLHQVAYTNDTRTFCVRHIRVFCVRHARKLKRLEDRVFSLEGLW